jgi:hypothetical protein
MRWIELTIHPQQTFCSAAKRNAAERWYTHLEIFLFQINMNKLTQRASRYSAFIVLLIGVFSGCSNPSWVDKYGDRICESMEKHVELLKSINSADDLKKLDEQVTKSLESHDRLDSEMISYSWKKNTSDLVLDKEQIASLAKRMDAALDAYEAEVERITKLAHYGEDKQLNHALHNLSTILENPFTPQRKRYLERQAKSRKQQEPTQVIPPDFPE